ncbi:hypothetical protein EDD11_002803 [Mortierella claussenii]|nr:hypothetical protein EDD11_002803 [Mortierella claussenii]
MHAVDYIYMILTIITIVFHYHPDRAFLRNYRVINLIILLFLAFIWLMLSTVWFTDLTWSSYPSSDVANPTTATPSKPLGAIPSMINNSSSSSFDVSSIPSTTAVAGGISTTVDGYTLFPGTEPTAVGLAIIAAATSTNSPIATATATATATVTPTVAINPSAQTPSSSASTSSSSSMSDTRWASQCHTSSGYDASSCELALVYHILSCFVSVLLILEGYMSWKLYVNEEVKETEADKAKKLKAEEEKKRLERELKKTKRIEKELRALEKQKGQVVIQGPMIG